MSEIGEKLARMLNPTEEIDIDFNAMLKAWRTGALNDDEFALCCIICARDYGRAGDFERVGHCLTYVHKEYFETPIQDACIKSDTYEKAVLELADIILKVEGSNSFCSTELFVDLT
jgi:hypothetical protein